MKRCDDYENGGSKTLTPILQVPPVSFAAPEGVYVLRAHVAPEVAPLGVPAATALSPRIGTSLSLLSIKSSESPPETLPVDLSAVPKYLDVPVNGDGSGSFAYIKTGKGNMKKAKAQISKPGPPFISRVVVNENLAKLLSSRAPETVYLFYNFGKTFIWSDYFSRAQSPLSLILFRDAFVTCHDVNVLTRENLDTVLGFSTGDILCYSPISGKSARINRNGAIHKCAITCIKWLPGSESHFVAGFEDGTVLFLDRELDDQAIIVPNTCDDFLAVQIVKNHKCNPIVHWQVGRKCITAISFSPDCQHVAITSLDGTLKIIDHLSQKFLDRYTSYFGGLLCAAWSPDGKFILTGGQDDLVSIWAFRGKIVARCQGHASWVTNVAFDPYRCTERNYRFGSVGEDTRLYLWDFSISSLHRPRATLYGSMPRTRSRCEVDRRVMFDAPTIHEVLSKSQVPIIESFAHKSVHEHPVCNIVFREDAIITSDRAGEMRVWSRPQSVER